MLRLVVLISGQGSNLQAILDAIAADRLDAAVGLVVSNRSKAAGLARARAAAVPTQVLCLSDFRAGGQPRRDYDAALAALVAEARPDLVVLAGWTHILSEVFLDQFRRRVINLHPALPGALPGLHAIERAWRDARAGGAPCTGVMVHYVEEAVDAGAPIAVERVPIEPDEPLDALEARIHEVEHRLIVRVLSELSAQAGPKLA